MNSHTRDVGDADCGQAQGVGVLAHSFGNVGRRSQQL